MHIRKEKPTDVEKIWNINSKVFESDAEANLVNAVRNSGIFFLSLVYEEGHDLVGHILFTPVELVGDTSGIRVMGLAPMAVVPGLQKKGIGSSLVKAGIQECISEDYDAIVVLGHPNYYPKFGFRPSINYGIKSEYEVPDAVFMLLELKKNSLRRTKGTVKYHATFGDV